jgi:hypothetical protein
MNMTRAAQAALVSVGERMVPREATYEHRRLVVDVRIEVLVTEAGGWCSER